MQISCSASKIQYSLLVLVGLLLAAWPAAAGEYRVLIDADDDPATGCSVTIAGSTFDGVEQIVVTTVDNGTDQVTAVARQECTDPGTDTFGGSITLSDFPTPWPVGVALGTLGSDVVETYFPLSALAEEPVSIRLGYASDDLLGNQDVMFTSTGGSGGDPIVVSLGAAPLEIPTVGPLGLLLLSLLLAGAAAWVLRDADRFAGGGTVAAVLLMVVLAPVALAVADILLDGDPSDWVGGIDAQGTDPAGDVPASADILAGYAAVSTDGTILYLRLDVTREAQPEAVDDAFTVTEDDPQTIFDVLANDTDLDGGLKEVVSITQPANGTVAITNAGADVGYTPDADYCNDGTPTDDFTYTVNGGSTATVAVTVNCVDDLPTAVDDFATVSEDSPPTTISVLSNDVDPDGGFSIQSVTQPANGSVVITNAGADLTYEPDPNYCNDGTPTDDFTYTLNGGSTATVAVTIPCNDDPPTAVDDAATVTEDDPATPIDVLLNDTDVDGGPKTINSVTQPTNGTVVITNGGADLTYQPDPDYCNDGTPTDDFTYALNGGSTATVAVTVTCVDDPPVAVDDTATLTEDDPATTIDVLLNDTDVDGGAMTINSVVQPANGTVVITNAGADLTYEPDPDYCNDGTSTDDFTYTLNGGSSGTVAVTVTCVNDPPVVTSPISYTAIGNTLLRVPGTDGDHDGGVPGRVASSADATDAFAKANPTDVDSGTPAFVAGTYGTTAAPGDGSLTIDDDGDFHYTPPTGFTGGTDTVAVNVADGDGGLTPVTFEFTVSDMVWYVEDTTGAKNPVGDTDGRSTDAFETLAAAEAASGAGHIILVMETDSPLDAGITLKSGQKLYGQRVEEETTSLMPAGFIWEEIADTNARPQIHRTNGATVRVDATAGALSNVEIRHLDLESGDDDAIAVTTAGSNVATVLIDENVIGAAGVHGVDVNAGHTSGTSTVTITDNTLASTGDGVNVSVDSGGDVDLAIDRLTNVTAGGEGIELRSPGVGTLTVTSFTANSIHQDTAGSGFVADDVTFDDGGGSVSASTFQVGTSGDGVGLGGMLLATVRGGLTFTDLDVEADGGTGVLVDNSSLAVGDFTLTTGAGSTVAAAGGPALDLDPMTAAVTLDNLVSTGSPTQGVRLVDVAGSVNVVAGSISGATGDAFLVDRGTAMVDYDGTIANTLARSVSVTNRPVGASNVTFGGDVGSSITQNSGTGILADSNAAGTVAFDGGVFLSTGTSPAVTLTSNGGATVNFNGGVDLDTSSGNGFVATGGGTVNVVSGAVSTTVNTTTGTAVEITSTTIGASGVTFDTVGTNGGPNGILLTSVPSGNFTASGGSIVNATNRGLDVSGGSGNVTVNASISTTNTGRSVEVTTKMGGTVLVSGAVDDNGLGVNLATNPGSTMSFTGGLALDTVGTNTAFRAVGGGTVNVTGTNDVGANTAVTRRAVEIIDTTIGASGVTFRSVHVNGGGTSAVPGIHLDDTGAGDFTVAGGGADGSGGTMQDIVHDAVRLFNTDGAVSLSDMIIEDIGNMGVVDSEHDAIHGETVDGGLVLDNVTIRRISDMALHGATANGDANTVWNGLTITNSTIEDANRYHVPGEGDTSDEGGVRIRGLRGTATITNNTFQDTGEHLDLFATAGTLNLTATGNNFFETYKEFSSGSIASVGKMCLDLTVQSSATAMVDISGANSFRNCRIASVRVGNDSAATGTVTSTVANNSFLVTDHSSGIGGDFDFPMGGVKYSTRGATTAVFDGRISGNTFTDVTNADGGVGNVTLDMDQGVIQVLVDGNTFHAPGNAAWFVRADGTSSFDLEFDNNTYQKDAFPCTTDPACGGGYDGPGLFNRTQVQNGAVLDVTYRNEDFAEHDTSFDPGNTVEVQVLNVGGGGTVCAFFTNNTSPHGYALEESAGDLNLYNGVSAVTGTCSGGAPANCVTVLDANSNTGGGGNPAADPPTVSVFGTIDIVSSACSLPSGGIFP